MAKDPDDANHPDHPDRKGHGPESPMQRYAAAMLSEVDPHADDIVMWDLQTRPDGMWLGVRRRGQVVVGLLFNETGAKAFEDAVKKAVEYRWPKDWLRG